VRERGRERGPGSPQQPNGALSRKGHGCQQCDRCRRAVAADRLLQTHLRLRDHRDAQTPHRTRVDRAAARAAAAAHAARQRERAARAAERQPTHPTTPDGGGAHRAGEVGRREDLPRRLVPVGERLVALEPHVRQRHRRRLDRRRRRRRLGGRGQQLEQLPRHQRRRVRAHVRADGAELAVDGRRLGAPLPRVCLGIVPHRAARRRHPVAQLRDEREQPVRAVAHPRDRVDVVQQPHEGALVERLEPLLLREERRRARRARARAARRSGRRGARRRGRRRRAAWHDGSRRGRRGVSLGLGRRGAEHRRLELEEGVQPAAHVVERREAAAEQPVVLAEGEGLAQLERRC